MGDSQTNNIPRPSNHPILISTPTLEKGLRIQGWVIRKPIIPSLVIIISTPNFPKVSFYSIDESSSPRPCGLPTWRRRRAQILSMQPLNMNIYQMHIRYVYNRYSIDMMEGVHAW